MSTPPTIYLVRHGETEWALNGRHTGRTDIPLTAKGEADAAKIGIRLRGMAFPRVFSSPLIRARRTAELAGFAPAFDPELMEWNYGEYEGLRTAEIRERRPDWILFQDGCPGGESVQEISDRVDQVIARLRALSGNVLLFAHGHVLRVLAARWVEQPAGFGRALYLGTATLSILDFDHHAMDEPTIRLWNDDRHLRDEMGLPNDLTEARLFHSQIEERLRTLSCSDPDVFAVKLAVEEALVHVFTKRMRDES